MVNTNLTSAFLLAKAVYPYMKRAGSGKIINTGSMASLFGAAYAAAYAASKGGLVQLTKSLALAWAADNIQVNAILPGWFETEMTDRARIEVPGLAERVTARIPAGRWAKPPDMAGVAIWLASRASNYVTAAAIPVERRLFGRDVMGSAQRDCRDFAINRSRGQGICLAQASGCAIFRLRGGMKFIPIGMADISRRLRPEADTAGIGTRKLASTPVGVAERWHPYRGARGIIRFRDRWYRPDGLNHRLMSGNPTGFLDLLLLSKTRNKNSIIVDTIPSHKLRKSTGNRRRKLLPLILYRIRVRAATR